MPARLEHIKELLQELQAELAGLDSVDAETTEMLSKVSYEIDQAQATSDPQRLRDAGFGGQLKQVLEQFEAEHPTLSELAGRFVNALGQLGI